MRIIYAIILVIFFSPALQAQLEFTPLQGNAVLQQVFAQEKATLEAKYGVYNAAEKVDCPPSVFFENEVLAGDSITIILDTIGSRIGGDSLMSITFLDCSVLDNGTVTTNFPTSTPNSSAVLPWVRHFSDPSTLIGFDTICAQICSFNEGCDTLYAPVFVKRRGQRHDVTGPTLNTYDIVDEFCVDETLLEGELVCSNIIECPDTYDGEGQQSVHPTLYTITTPCLFYGASGFSGEDLVCYEMCDEYGICDTFDVVYTILGETIELPFFDDFANNDGVYPIRDLWVDRDVYINNTMAPNPPSIGMATFDGLDPTGTPYDNFGQGDDLTSKPIDMSLLSGEEDIYFKCYVAARGYGLYPNFPDSLVLEFRNTDREWERAGSWNGFTSNPGAVDPFPWEFFSVRIEDEEFFHDAFQFRFQSYHSPGGLDDLWHVDYVKIEANENDTPINEDVAFTETPRSLLSRYTAMPWKQFKANVDGEIRNDGIKSAYFNHNNETETVSGGSFVKIKNLTTGVDLSATNTVTDATNVNSQEYTSVDNDNATGFWSQVKNELSGFPADTEKADLSFNFSFPLANQATGAFINDNTNFVTHLDNYYAYDDGTAESAVFLVNQQNDAPEYAIRYRANVEDQLQGVRFHFPHVDIDQEAGQAFSIKVWVDPTGSNDYFYLENNEPDYVRQFVSPTYPDSFTDSLQALTTYALEDENGDPAPLTIPAGADFYIGFQQTSLGLSGAHVGFDVQYDARPHTFLNLGTFWFPIPDQFNGAIMYRPVMGDETTGNTAVDDLTETDDDPVRLFPNPTTGEVNVILAKGNYTDYNIHIFNNVGQLVRIEKGSNLLNLNNLQNGVYHLQFVNKNSLASYFRKIVVAK
ncbi:MAG: hypothetical protein ACI85O_002798 [Saprospiraceae bacterium]|jgi:hypothetical protein